MCYYWHITWVSSLKHYFFPYSVKEFVFFIIHTSCIFFWLTKGLHLRGSCLDFEAPRVAVEHPLHIKLSEWHKEPTPFANHSEPCSIAVVFLVLSPVQQTSITWKRVKDVNSQAPPRTCWIRNSKGGAQQCVFPHALRWCCCNPKFLNQYSKQKWSSTFILR